MRPPARLLARLSIALLGVCSAAGAADVDYQAHIKPLLKSKCYACHGVLKQEAGLRLETRSLMLAGGDSGDVLIPGEASGSLLLQRVTADPQTRMPPEGAGSPLTAEDVERLSAWIAAGAIAPEEVIPEAPTAHWAFQPIARSASPKGAASPGFNVIDAFLDGPRQSQGVVPQPLAERSLRIRRLYLDLIGLPPTRAQLHDERPWELIVDELLASPHHGERWGRHWMDIWRYSDWYGLGAQLRNSQKHLWRWRDWIVDSLNRDTGYDRMILEMLAGDELAPDDPQVVAGTGFLARNYYLFNRTTWLDSTIEHTGKAFLGLTLNCAKCHDHKYDPISQVDYYNFRAFLEPHQVRLDPVPGVIDFEQDGLPRVFDDQLSAPTYLHRRGDPSQPDEEQAIAPAIPAVFNTSVEITPVRLPPAAYAPGVRGYVVHDHLQAADAAVASAQRELEVARQRHDEVVAANAAAAAAASAADFAVTEEFDAPNDAVWEIVGDGWEYRAGTLQQTQATRDEAFVRLRQPLPRDFEMTCRYTTTGGTTYKSVTFRFDRTADGRSSNFVYTSAHEPGPKVQVAYTRDGSTVYPAEGRVGQTIRVDQALELRFAVRDRLVNVWLDGEFLLAYRLPDRGPDNAPAGERSSQFAFSGFDATVAFDALSLRALPPDLPLVEPGGKVESPEAVLELATARLTAAQRRRDALTAVVAADKARYLDASAGDGHALARIAARCQAEAAVADAEVDRLAAGSDATKLKAAEARLLQAREQLDSLGEESTTYASLRASLKALETPAHKEADYPPVYPDTSTGRRLALARWIASPDNPLTARVAVNHVWMRHFGEPLVESVFDFGLRTPRPLHADLLDSLAAEFMESGWSFKSLHRLIVTSQAYQLSSSPAGTTAHTIDPGNRLYWRMNARRMESQIVRDALLHLSGTLDRSLGGPSLDVGSASRRRSLYFKHSRDDQNQFLSMFDDADLLQCYRRSESIVPQQALALANSRLSLDMADAIAAHVSSLLPTASEAAFVPAAFELILGREPTAEEAQACRAFWAELAAVLAMDDSIAAEGVEARIRARLVHSLFNHNDFITIR